MAKKRKGKMTCEIGIKSHTITDTLALSFSKTTDPPGPAENIT